MLSTDFGVPIDPTKPNEFAPKLDSDENEDEASNQSTKSTTSNKLRCWRHTQKLFENAVQEYNRQSGHDDEYGTEIRIRGRKKDGRKKKYCPIKIDSKILFLLQ